MPELMRSLGVCVGMVLAAAAAGCHTGGTLSGSGGVGVLSGAGGKAGGSGGVGTGMLGTGGAGPATTGASGSFGADVCGRPLAADPVLAKIMLLLDTSASMNGGADGVCTANCTVGSKWSVAVGAIEYEVGYRPLVEWGLEPIGSGGASCDVGGIEVGVAQNNSVAIGAALGRHSAAGQLALSGNRPTGAAVSVAAAHLAAQTLPGNAAIVLITDGVPNCHDGMPNESDVPVETLAVVRSTGIPIYVVGLGPLDSAASDALTTMAVEGGVPRADTPSYYPATRSTDIVPVLDQVIAAGACMFSIPWSPSLDGVTSRENISVITDRGEIPQDANAGWTYADNTHTTFTLHGPACALVTSDATQVVSVVYRCPLP